MYLNRFYVIFEYIYLRKLPCNLDHGRYLEILIKSILLYKFFRKNVEYNQRGSLRYFGQKCMS